MKTNFINFIRKFFDSVSRNAEARLVDDIKWDILALQQLSPLRPSSYVPWPRPALSPRSLAIILNDIVMNGRNNIVELGCGVSTIYIASLLKSLGDKRHFVSIEQDEQFMEIIIDILKREKVDSLVTFIHAPLSECDLTYTHGLKWYDTSTVSAELPFTTIDSLIIDGPSTESSPMIRYPALPFCVDKLSDRWFVALDDAKRKGEAAILTRWRQEHDIDFVMHGHLAYATNGLFYKPMV